MKTLAGALALSIVLVSCTRVPREGHTSAPTGGDPWAAFAEGWTELPPPPEIRDGAALAWADEELIYWSGIPTGREEPVTDGFAFDPAMRTWTRLPPAPGLGRYSPRAVWAGSEVLFLAGTHTGALDGVAFDPSDRTWRRIKAWPAQRRIATDVWTGEEVIFWGGGSPGGPPHRRGLAYDPGRE